MAGEFHAKPKGIDALAAELAALRREVNALRSGAPIRNSTISGGAGLAVVDGGLLKVVDSGGTVIAEFGALPGLAPKLDGSPQVGFVFRRDSGEPVAYCYTNVSGGLQSWAWQDRAGNGIVADDAFSGVGLATPYISMPWAHAVYTTWPGTTSSTFVDLWRSDIVQQHPVLDATIGATTDVSGTTGEVRLMVDGVQVDTTLTVGFGIGWNPFFGTFPSGGGWLARRVVTVQARRTAGTGTVRCEPSGLQGIQS